MQYARTIMETELLYNMTHNIFHTMRTHNIIIQYSRIDKLKYMLWVKLIDFFRVFLIIKKTKPRSRSASRGSAIEFLWGKIELPRNLKSELNSMQSLFVFV